MIEIHANYPKTGELAMVVSDGGPDGHGHTFHDWGEINDFINELRDKAYSLFGPDYSDPAYDE